MMRSCSLTFAAALTSALLMVMVTRSGGMECTGTNLLKQIHRDVLPPSKCNLDCTRWSFLRRESQDTRTIRFTDSETDDLGNYCWPMPLRCNTGEYFQHAFVVLPVDESREEAGTLKIALLPHNDRPPPQQQQPITLPPHHRTPLVPDACGLPFDISAHFIRGQSSPKLCVQIVSQHSIMGNGVLRCPPFLVSMWQRG